MNSNIWLSVWNSNFELKSFKKGSCLPPMYFILWKRRFLQTTFEFSNVLYNIYNVPFSEKIYNIYNLTSSEKNLSRSNSAFFNYFWRSRNTLGYKQPVHFFDGYHNKWKCDGQLFEFRNFTHCRLQSVVINRAIFSFSRTPQIDEECWASRKRRRIGFLARLPSCDKIFSRCSTLDSISKIKFEISDRGLPS